MTSHEGRIGPILLYERLTPREAELGLLMATGLDSTAIASKVGWKDGAHTRSQKVKLYRKFTISAGYDKLIIVTLWFYEHRVAMLHYTRRYEAEISQAQAWEEAKEMLPEGTVDGS